MKTLADWLPTEYRNGGFTHLDKHMDQIVIREVSFGGWVGTHKNVRSWCVLKNGLAVGWNESPTAGHSFPKRRVNIGYNLHNHMDKVEDRILEHYVDIIKFDIVGGNRKYYIIDENGEKKHGRLIDLVLFH